MSVAVADFDNDGDLARTPHLGHHLRNWLWIRPNSRPDGPKPTWCQVILISLSETMQTASSLFKCTALLWERHGPTLASTASDVRCRCRGASPCIPTLASSAERTSRSTLLAAVPLVRPVLCDLCALHNAQNVLRARSRQHPEMIAPLAALAHTLHSMAASSASSVLSAATVQKQAPLSASAVALARTATRRVRAPAASALLGGFARP